MTITNDRLDALSALGGDISDLVMEVRQLRNKIDQRTEATVAPASPLRVGNNVFIRTVTYHHTGHIEAITETEVILSSAAWISDSGRWATALRTGALSEVEPFPSVVSVGRATIVDVSDWTHTLPKDQK